MKFCLILIICLVTFVNHLYSQEWTYVEDFYVSGDAGGDGPHGVVFTPDNRIWLGNFFLRETITTAEGNEVFYSPIKVYNPDGSIHQIISTLTYNDIIDTLFDNCRGLSLDNNGNVLYTAADKLWRINYTTYEAMNKIVPVPLVTLTEAACDENGFIYLAHVASDGRPLYIFDENFVLYGYVQDSLYEFQRSLVISPDGKNLYLGKLGGLGIEHYYSETGPDPLTEYTLVNTYYKDSLEVNCLDWDRSGLLWAGAITRDYIYFGGIYTGWYALDPTNGFAMVDSIGQNAGNPETGPSPPLGGTFYAPRGAAWSLDGHDMYTADFNGNVYKKWYNPNPLVSNIQLSVGTYNAYPGDTLLVTLSAAFNTYNRFDSTKIEISGFHENIEFLGIVDDGSLLGDLGWNINMTNSENLLILSSTGPDTFGSSKLSGSGELLWLRFAVPDTAVDGFVPIHLDGGIFKPGTIPTTLTSGGINVEFMSGISESKIHIPEEPLLHQNFPNPFNPSTTIEYSIPKSAMVEVSIYNLAGKKLQTLVNHNHTPGNYQVTWDGSDYASGVYIYQIKDDGIVQSKKMLLLK